MTTAVNNDTLRQQLQAGADALNLGLTDTQVTLLMDFLALLQKWNKVYNLTAVRDPQEMLTHHLLDSLAAVAPSASPYRGACGAGQGRCALARCGLGRRLARRGVCHLLPARWM